jgi:5-hydroxyisourate hydrolase-like protein (transthyretin family)
MLAKNVVILFLAALIATALDATASSITGTVTGPDGSTPLQGVQVEVYVKSGSAWNYITSDSTDVNGQYEFTGLAAGTYRVAFRDPGGNYACEVYNNIPGYSPYKGGTDIAVPEATTVPNINASLAQASKITGTVTGPDETTPLANIYVGAHRWTGSQWEWWTATDYTDANGFFEISGLPAGTYRVTYDDRNGNYASEIYNNIPGHSPYSGGTDIAVPEANTVPNINASLAQASKITGTVTGPDGTTPLANIYVGAHRWTGSQWEWWTATDYTDANGQYEIGGLPAGTYRVTFDDWNGNYASEVYNNVPGRSLYNGGTDIAVPQATTVPNINASLATASKITGTVTGPDGTTPLANVQVVAYRWNGSWWSWEQSANTGANGQYEIGGLNAGTYHVSFRDNSGTYASETYNNIPGDVGRDSGTEIPVPAGSTIPNINASLATASKITGTITGPDGTTPLANVRVVAYRWDGSWWSWEQSANTGANGQYEIGGLNAGTYRVSFSDPNGNYIPEVYDNIPGDDAWNIGTEITVPESTIVPNINASLAQASKITGTVTGPDGITPLANVWVEAYRWNGSWWSWEQSANTGANGQYEIGGLNAGTYRVTFNDYNTGHLPETYNNIPGDDVWDPNHPGTDIVVPAATTVPDINASLDQPANLGGVVTQSGGSTPIPGVPVHLLDASGTIIRTRTTDANGAYFFSNLYPGSYRVRTAPTGGNSPYLGQWYSGVLYIPGHDAPPPTATAVLLSSGETRDNVNFALNRAGKISGTVMGNGTVYINGAHVKARETASGVVFEAGTDAGGVYELLGMIPGSYTLKVEADHFADEWWNNATHRDQATTFPVAIDDILWMPFDLASGQSPGFVEVTSDPSGAAIYLDHQPTTNVTPAILDLGEVASHCVSLGGGIASHTITVKKAGYPRPPPDTVWAEEAGTTQVHFDMTGNATGSLSLATDPPGASVYVDYADTADGVTPTTVQGLEPGSHVILLRKTGWLHPRPIIASVLPDLTTTVTVTLATNDLTASRVIADARSTPPGATIHVDYLPTTNITDAVIDWMDPASHAGDGWYTASHTIMLRGNGFRTTAPRYVGEETNVVQAVAVNLIVDPVSAVDEDDDDLPDQWEDAYDLKNKKPTQNGPDDDPDGDGATNEEEMRAGTNPLDGNSVFGVSDTAVVQDVGLQTVVLTFSTVPGRAYIVQGTDDLTHNWVNYSGVITATDTAITVTITLPAGTPGQFFRLVVLAP